MPVPSPRDGGEKVAEGRMRGFGRTLTRPSATLSRKRERALTQFTASEKAADTARGGSRAATASSNDTTTSV